MDLKEVLSNFYCRLCLTSLKSPKKYVDIQNETQLLQKITEIFRFNPNKTKNSSLLCLDCHSRVNSIAEFIKNVQTNQNLLEQADLVADVQCSMNEAVVKEENEMAVEYLEESDDFSTEEEIKPEPKVYICHCCSQNFRNKNLLSTHMKRQHLSSFDCQICAESFLSRAAVSEHYKEFHVTKQQKNSQSIKNYLVCELCEDNFEQFTRLTEHYQAKHGVRGYVRCCNKQFFTRKSVVNHNDVHLNPAEYMCKICQKLLPDKYTFRDHVQRHKPDADRKFECHHCQKKFHVQKDLTDHINRLHRKVKKEERETCVTCDKSFVSKYSLMTHNRRFHMDIERPICESCGKVCRSNADLTAHIKARHTEPVRQKCDICGSYVKYLQQHKQIHVESKMHVKCDICGLETTTLKYLRLHMKSHSNEKPFTCNSCGAAFKRKNALKDHISTHNGIPRHFCDFCDKTFNNSGNKSKHMKHVHAQELSVLKEPLKR